MIPQAKRHYDSEKAHGRCNQVLDAAAVCFARSGFHGASMAQISKEARMSAGHIYNYFPSKDAIILAFVERESAYVTGILRDLEARDDPLQALLDEAPHRVNEVLDPQPWHVPLEMYAEASRNPNIAARLMVYENSSRERLREIVKAGRARRGLSVDGSLIDSRTDAIVVFFQGLSIRALNCQGMDRAAMADAFCVAMRALLMT